MGRYQEQVARRNARYEYDIPDGALHCEVVSGTEPVLDDEGRTVGVRTWRGVRYLLRLDAEQAVTEDPERALRLLLGECLLRSRLALTALDLFDPSDPAEPEDRVEVRAILSAMVELLVTAGTVDPTD
jgi:hypothetical protein